ncbi:NADH-quinone oxidoreductase subunit M [Rhodobacter sp. Har01]|uniref:complex I subunit 4 family protein n=1 Tax=Rhodobacter sp. Har01 TaxID=2883999 RepID=UPI001D069721|nr:NADH-quinone oxidoreductase subunit M [Rhodobacter sp. Har01]MCB6179930.1 NADH-quinone oxidoreductase subunit M [Rhodobacter sp. Har01]
MALTLLILFPFLGGVFALLAGKAEATAARIAAAVFLICGLLTLAWVVQHGDSGRWIMQSRHAWAPALGVNIILAIDGLSFILVALSLALGLLTVVLSWNSTDRAPLLHAALCWTVAASNGVFLSFDLVVFVFFWEMMLIPAFLLIAIWGHANREAAAMKFLIFNAIAGLGLLAAVFWIGATGPTLSFDAFEVAKRDIPVAAQIWLLLGFALAFMVKLPAPPFHAWLPDAHTEAPTVGSILLAGLLLKTGAYGLFRFPAMLFPEGMHVLAPWGMALGAFGTIYGALVACGQTDAKRLVAYTSVAHMSVVLMGICGGVHFSLMGAGIVMVAHAFSASALFLLIGAIHDRVHTRDLRELGGLQRSAPRFAAAFALFFAATLAMPGTANFLGEALVITGLFQVNWVYASITLVSLVISVVYGTRLFQRIVFGTARKTPVSLDLSFRELGPVIALAIGTLLFGLLPQFLMFGLDTAVNSAVDSLNAAAP